MSRISGAMDHTEESMPPRRRNAVLGAFAASLGSSRIAADCMSLPLTHWLIDQFHLPSSVESTRFFPFYLDVFPASMPQRMGLIMHHQHARSAFLPRSKAVSTACSPARLYAEQVSSLPSSGASLSRPLPRPSKTSHRSRSTPGS